MSSNANPQPLLIVRHNRSHHYYPGSNQYGHSTRTVHGGGLMILDIMVGLITGKAGSDSR